MSCKHVDTCELFPELASNSALKIWQVFYCDGDFSQCVRYQQTQKAKAVPITLLPNGKTMSQSILDRNSPALGEAEKTSTVAQSTQTITQRKPQPQDRTVTKPIAVAKDVICSYYLRIATEAGVDLLKQVQAILKEFDVTLDATNKKRGPDGSQWLIFVTDQVPEMKLYRAIVRIEELAGLFEKVKCVTLERSDEVCELASSERA